MPLQKFHLMGYTPLRFEKWPLWGEMLRHLANARWLANLKVVEALGKIEYQSNDRMFIESNATLIALSGY